MELMSVRLTLEKVFEQRSLCTWLLLWAAGLAAFFTASVRMRFEPVLVCPMFQYRKEVQV